MKASLKDNLGKSVMLLTGIAYVAGLCYFRGKNFDDNTLKQEYIISGENFNEKVGRIQYRYDTVEHRPVQFTIHSESDWRDYPSAGKSLPRGEVKEYKSGRVTVDLYFPRE